jgi:hypothetical protein
MRISGDLCGGDSNRGRGCDSGRTCGRFSGRRISGEGEGMLERPRLEGGDSNRGERPAEGSLGVIRGCDSGRGCGRLSVRLRWDADGKSGR